MRSDAICFSSLFNIRFKFLEAVRNQAFRVFQGHVSTEFLKSVKTSEKMGKFKESHSCTSESSDCI